MLYFIFNVILRVLCFILWGALLLGAPAWLRAWAILGVKVTTSKSIVFPANDRPAGRPCLFSREFWRTHFVESGTPSWFIIFLWVFCTCTREWRWRRSWRRYHFGVCWGSPMWPSKLYFSAEIFKNVLKILRSMRIKFTFKFETFWPDMCSLRIIYVYTFADDVVWGSCTWVSKMNMNTNIKCFCSWSEDKYLWTKNPARGT